MSFFFANNIRERLAHIDKINYVEGFQPKANKEDYYYLYTIEEQGKTEFSIGYKSTVAVKVLFPENVLDENSSNLNRDILDKIISALGRGKYDNDKFVQKVDFNIEAKNLEEGLWLIIITFVFIWEAIN